MNASQGRSEVSFDVWAEIGQPDSSPMYRSSYEFLDTCICIHAYFYMSINYKVHFVSYFVAM